MTYRFGRKRFTVRRYKSKYEVWRMYDSGAQKLIYTADSDMEAKAMIAECAADEISDSYTVSAH
jgi:hypothetical protein